MLSFFASYHGFLSWCKNFVRNKNSELIARRTIIKKAIPSYEFVFDEFENDRSRIRAHLVSKLVSLQAWTRKAFGESIYIVRDMKIKTNFQINRWKRMKLCGYHKCDARIILSKSFFDSHHLVAKKKADGQSSWFFYPTSHITIMGIKMIVMVFQIHSCS